MLLSLPLQGLYGDQNKVTLHMSVLPGLMAKMASVYNQMMFAISHPMFLLALQEVWPWFCIHEQKDDDSKSTMTEAEK